MHFYVRMDKHDGEDIELVPYFSVNGSLCKFPPRCCGFIVGCWGRTRYRPKYDILGSVVAEVTHYEGFPCFEVGLAA